MINTTMTELRRLNADDMPQLSRLHSVVYNNRRVFTEGEPRDPLSLPPEWSWGFFENGKLQSGMMEINYLMNFDGNSVPMSGIAGVGTLPESRKGGLVRAIFEKLLPEAYERGVIFSCLAPFSYSYYRQFGYEISCARNRISIPLKDFSHQKLRGNFTQVFPGDDTTDLAEVHSEYIKKVNHGIHRDHWPENLAWRQFTNNDPYAKGIFLYQWKDESGKNGGHVKYEVRKEPNKTIASISELVFRDMESLYGILSIFGVQNAQIDGFEWLMPSFIDPMDLTQGISKNDMEIEQRIILRDMTRVINVKAALEMMRMETMWMDKTVTGSTSTPNLEGDFCIGVEDSLIHANNANFLVEFGKQGKRVSITKKEPDIKCDIPALSQLITGYRSLDSMLFSKQKGLEVYGNRNVLSGIFRQRPQHLTEYF